MTMRLSALSVAFLVLGACGPILVDPDSDAEGDSSGSASDDFGGDTTTEDGSPEGTDDALDPDEGEADSGDSGPAGDSETGTDSNEDDEDSAETDEGGQTDDSGESGDEGDSGDDSTGESGDEGDSDEGDENSGGGSEDSGSGDSGSSDPEPCQVSQKEFTPEPTNVLLTLDKSGSMSLETWDHDQDPNTPEVTRWNSLHGAVSRLTMSFQDRVKFGVKLFPAFDADGLSSVTGCVVDPGVEVPCALDNSATVIAGIPPADTQVQGGTPIESGLSEGITYLESLPEGQPKVLLFVADGGIGCNEDFTAAVNMVSDAATVGIPTYVLGIAPDPNDPSVIDDPFDQLTALAQAAGTINPDGPHDFYSLENELDLDEVMDRIISDSLQCFVDIEPVPAFPDLFQIWIADEQVPRVTDCSTESGWHWASQFDQVEFCNAACDRLKTESSMEGRYFCPP